MKSKKGFQFFLEMEKIMGTSIFSTKKSFEESIFSTKKSFEESIFSGNGKNHGNINFFHEKIIRRIINLSLARLM
jgi:hypothetical protein